ncbi:uracil-DNA glycosylase [Thalassotalea ponticola]|uniref:uracil-DNA glycosylase n=1 Tax=Thalassotalea ponticola TaxID=1523392 RepID=UPI0025B30DE9|nr:uracil-DNA glycosylase [Thalassotalea ponticola]MDN3652038.1 uracil-DNA glycosylase [Thalassotalea ponticola]
MNHWQVFLQQQQAQPYFKALQQNIAKQRAAGEMIYPQPSCVYRAFELTPFDAVKVVVLGQDPYHGPNQAHGLAFSVEHGVRVPPSLNNMYKELTTDIDGFTAPSHGNLTAWAEQGVLLLNTVLTVRQGQAHSHAKIGWETFTDRVIEELNQHRDNLVFILWGKHAQNKGKQLDNKRHLILSGAHPSPLSAYRGFFGCKHFSKTNHYLRRHGIEPINWQLTEPRCDEQQGRLF